MATVHGLQQPNYVHLRQPVTQCRRPHPSSSPALLMAFAWLFLLSPQFTSLILSALRITQPHIFSTVWNAPSWNLPHQVGSFPGLTAFELHPMTWAESKGGALPSCSSIISCSFIFIPNASLYHFSFLLY